MRRTGLALAGVGVIVTLLLGSLVWGSQGIAAQPGGWDFNQCDDGRDNDGDLGDDNNPADSDVNDGCPQVGAFSEAGVAGGCNNNIDEVDEDPGAPVVNDDRIVNDGCLTPKGTQEEDGPPLGLECGNGLDDDGDGTAEDGCGGGNPAATGPVGQPEVTNTCGAGNNTDDDDLDGRINDGCPAVGVAEVGGQCLDAVDNGEDTPADNLINDGCPVFDNPNIDNPPVGDPDISEAYPVAVGGIAELPDVAGASADEAGVPAEGSGWSAGSYAALAGGLAAAAVVLGAGVWYARRRFSRS